MISNCMACGKVIAKYAPLDEVRWELCADCVSRVSRDEQGALSCGEPECLFPEIPYECLRRVADSASAPSFANCPARAGLRSPLTDS